MERVTFFPPYPDDVINSKVGEVVVSMASVFYRVVAMGTVSFGWLPVESELL